jgi:hypothetical protein
MACRLPAIGETPLLISQRLLANKARHLDGFKASELSLPHSPVSKSGAVLLVRVRLSLAARRHPARPDTEAKGDTRATESYEGKGVGEFDDETEADEPISLHPRRRGCSGRQRHTEPQTVGVVGRSAACQWGSARAVCASAQRTKGQESRVTEHSGGINDP